MSTSMSISMIASANLPRIDLQALAALALSILLAACTNGGGPKY
jgi:hypothetical protein